MTSLDLGQNIERKQNKLMENIRTIDYRKSKEAALIKLTKNGRICPLLTRNLNRLDIQLGRICEPGNRGCYLKNIKGLLQEKRRRHNTDSASFDIGLY